MEHVRETGHCIVESPCFRGRILIKILAYLLYDTANYYVTFLSFHFFIYEIDIIPTLQSSSED